MCVASGYRLCGVAAVGKPPFIAIPRVHLNFDFRVMRQNRRVTVDDARKDQIESFHGVLFDVAHGICSQRVRDYLVHACPSLGAPGCDRTNGESFADFFNGERRVCPWRIELPNCG